MTVDLDTLLRDAGREPTIELDVDEVHARGRRRRVARRATGVGGAIVLIGALAVGLPALLDDRPQLDVIDEGPAGVDGGPVVDGAPTGVTPRAALAAELGVDVQLHRYDPGQELWMVERTGTDGSSDVRVLELPPLLGDPVVTPDGALWSSEGALLREDVLIPLTGGPPLPGAALPVGTDATGRVLVTAVPLPDLDPGGPIVRAVTPDGQLHLADADVAAAELPGDTQVLTADEASGHALVLGLRTSGEQGTEPAGRLLLPDGTVRDLLSEPDVAAAVTGQLVAGRIVGDEVWIAHVHDDGTSGIVRIPLDPDAAVTVLPTPMGGRVVGEVTAIAPGPDGDVVLLARRDGDDALPPLVVRPAMADASADGAITELDAPGVPTLLVPAADDQTVGAVCDPAARNAPPVGGTDHVWFACFEDGGSLDPFPFQRVAIPTVERGDVEDVVAGLVQVFLDGPTEEHGDGLKPLAPPGQVELRDITYAPPRVTIEVVTTGDTGIPTGSTDGWSFRVALAASVLQLDGIDEVVTVTDGVCGDWEGTTDQAAADDCIVWTDADMPWNQPAT